MRLSPPLLLFPRRDSPKPCCSRQRSPKSASTSAAYSTSSPSNSGLAAEFGGFSETASFLTGLNPNMFGERIHHHKFITTTGVVLIPTAPGLIWGNLIDNASSCHVSQSCSLRVFINSSHPPPGLDDWSDTGVLAQVLAASQQEYLDSLKKKNANESAQEWKRNWRGQNQLRTF